MAVSPRPPIEAGLCACSRSPPYPGEQLAAQILLIMRLGICSVQNMAQSQTFQAAAPGIEASTASARWIQLLLGFIGGAGECDTER